MLTDPIKQKPLEQQMSKIPNEVKFCKRCVVSNQRPRIVFDDDGICSACRFAEYKYKKIDWKSREDAFKSLLDKYRKNDGTWDVLVPCSGGKDSSFVAHQLKQKYGMHPLTITWAPFVYTDIGFKNFVSFKDAGFNNLMAWQNGIFHRKLARVAFEELGDAWQPFAYGQMCYVLHLSINFGIPLIMFGENGEAEYGGDTASNDKTQHDWNKWAMNYFKGIHAEKLVNFALEHKDYFKKDDFDPSDLTFYKLPDIGQLTKNNVQFHWFGYYHKWVPQENYYYAQENTGFTANPQRSEGTYSKYASLDDRLDGFHFYLAYIKFGIARATSDAAHEVRDGHLTREEAVALVKRYDGEFPQLYFQEFLDYLGIDEGYFNDVIDSWRRPNLWEKSGNIWKLKHQVS